MILVYFIDERNEVVAMHDMPAIPRVGDYVSWLRGAEDDKSFPVLAVEWKPHRYDHDGTIRHWEVACHVGEPE